MNEETMEMENTTENPTQNQTEETEVITTSETSSEITVIVTDDVSEGYPNHDDNVVHELFETLGVNLDYVPKNPYQCFTMGCSLICALFVIIWFCKFMLALSRDFFK